MTAGVEEARCDPIAEARALHARFNVRRPYAVPVELIAAELGAYTLWRHAGAADARVVRAGDRAYLGIAEHARGTARARFSIAHELGHFLMHSDVDAIARIHGEERTEREHRYEHDANKFAVELLMPIVLATPLCTAPSPRLADVGALARRFETSLTVAGRRWAELSPAPCAFVESRDGVIKRAKRSTAFRGIAVERRKIDPTWGSAKARVEVRSESVNVPGTNLVLTWLVHE